MLFQLSLYEKAVLIKTHFHVNHAELAKVLGIPEGSMNHHLTGRSGNLEKRARINQQLEEISAHWQNPSYLRDLLENEKHPV